MLTKPGKIIPILLVVTLLAVSVASVVAAPVSQADTVEVICVEDYEVQSDDWLSKIAVEFYGDPLLYTAIFQATNAAAAAGGDYASLANPDAIEVGQVLCIPSLEVAQALVAGGQAVMAPAGAAEPAEEEAAVPATAAIVISGDARLGTLAEALALTGLEETLTAPDAGPFTLFAPTDAAFDTLPGGGLAWLLANPDRLAQVLRYHLVPVSLTAGGLEAVTQVDTLLGQPLEVTTSNGALSVGGVTLNETNLLQTANGPVYVIDTVLLPPDIRADLLAAGEEEVVAAEEAGETAAEAGEAAAEEAAAGAGEPAVAGTGEEAAEAGAEEAPGGLADELLSDLAQAGAPVEEAAGAAEPAEEEAAVPATAAIVISGDARLSTLAEALALTGLEETLAVPGAGPFTLFAPTDAAFDTLPGGGLAWLLANPDRLAQVLRYHLVPVSLTAGGLEAVTQVDTLLGQPLEVTTSNGALSVGGVTLNETNLLQTANGPVYVIDTVLLPPDIRADLLAAGEEMAAEAEEAAGATEERTGGLADELLSDLAQAGAPVEEAAEAGEMAAPAAEEAAAEAEEPAAAGTEAAAPEAQEPAGAEAEGAAGEPAGSRVIIFNFAQALTAATQSGRLQLNAPVTIFAPTSNAFALLPQAELANLAADPVRLQNLLLNHLVPGTVWSADLAGTPTLNSLIGQPLDTSIENGKYMIEDAQVLVADFRFGNVVIHLIDKVLLPEETR